MWFAAARPETSFNLEKIFENPFPAGEIGGHEDKAEPTLYLFH